MGRQAMGDDGRGTRIFAFCRERAACGSGECRALAGAAAIRSNYQPPALRVRWAAAALAGLNARGQVRAGLEKANARTLPDVRRVLTPSAACHGGLPRRPSPGRAGKLRARRGARGGSGVKLGSMKCAKIAKSCPFIPVDSLLLYSVSGSAGAR